MGDKSRTDTRDRVRAISDALFLSGLTFTALEAAHKCEVCAAGVCERMRRRGYSWGAVVGYAGATVGYLWLVGSRRDTVSLGLDRSGALAARVSWWFLPANGGTAPVVLPPQSPHRHGRILPHALR